MKPLRELAKGYQYMRDEDGNGWVVFLAPSSTTPTTALVWPYGGAPPECFADAPAEPKVEERTLRSPDGAFVMTVWLKDDPMRIEARVEQQPEEWRGDGGTVKVIAPRGTLPRLAVHSYLSPYLFGHALVLRGRERDRDGVVFECRFETSSDRDAYLAELEAAVAAMPRLADQFKVEDRVVVAGESLPLGGGFADPPGLIGKGGTIKEIVHLGTGKPWAEIHLDDAVGKERKRIYLINLRHEREDERPAEKRPEPLRANFPPPQYHGGFPVLPIAEKKSDPEGWKREFYPTEASECAGGSVLDAIRHSLRTWTGRRKANLERYGLESPPFPARATQCGLCRHTRAHSPNVSIVWCGYCGGCVLRETKTGACGTSGALSAWESYCNPEPMIAALEKCLEQEQAKQEPKPPERKYEDGQWFRPYRRTTPLRIQGANYDVHHGVWYYSSMDVQGNDCGPQWWIPEYSCEPCPPPLSEAQRMLNPGDKVTVRKQRWDENGKPLPDNHDSACYCLASSWSVHGLPHCQVGSGEIVFDEWLHNLEPLDPAEEK